MVVGARAGMGRVGISWPALGRTYLGGYYRGGGIMSKHAIGAMELRIEIAKGALSSAMADVENAATRLERATKRLSALNSDIESYEKALEALKAEES
jgi:predicted  nucleic acid-binding Zn-ribbon protein